MRPHASDSMLVASNQVPLKNQKLINFLSGLRRVILISRWAQKAHSSAEVDIPDEGRNPEDKMHRDSSNQVSLGNQELINFVSQ